jgi:riboflavin synthase
MFTGIIEKIGLIQGVRGFSPSPGRARAFPDESAGPGSRLLEVVTGFDDLALGESVAVNGVCLTVAGDSAPGRQGVARFYVSPETLSLTNLGRLVAGSHVNLERALALGGRLSGHLVQGHVDGQGELVSVREIASSEGSSWELRVALPPGLERYCVHKGSIALDGVSLTINSLDSGVAGLLLVPHTWQNTVFCKLRPGDRVNVEVDLMAKYAEKLLCRS